MTLASLLIDEGRRLAVVLGEVVIGDSRSTSSSLVVPSHLFDGWHRAWIVLKPWTVRLSLSSLNSTVRKKRKRKSLLRVRLNYYQPHFFATSPAKVYWGWYYYGLLFTAFCWPPCLPSTFFSFTFPLQLFPPLLFVITINRLPYLVISSDLLESLLISVTPSTSFHQLPRFPSPHPQLPPNFLDFYRVSVTLFFLAAW